MSDLAAIGPRHRIAGFALAGAMAYPAQTAVEAVRAWHDLPDDVALIVLSQEAAAAISRERVRTDRRLTVVLP